MKNAYSYLNELQAGLVDLSKADEGTLEQVVNKEGNQHCKVHHP